MENHRHVLEMVDREFGNRQVLFVGDLMLDRHLIGDIQRISPEAPVPVLHQTQGLRRCGPTLSFNDAFNADGLVAKDRL